MKSRFKALGLAVASVGICAAPAHAGGTFMLRSDASAELIQIVDGPDHSISGSLTRIEVSSAGKLETSQYTLVGSRDGQGIHISLSSGVFGIGNKQLVGDEQGNVLRLSGPDQATGFATWKYSRASITEFDRATKELRRVADAVASNVAQTKATRTAEDQIKGWTLALAKLESDSRDFLADRHKAETYLQERVASYDEIEGRMKAISPRSVPALLDPLDVRNAKRDAQFEIQDLEHQAKEVDWTINNDLANHVAFAGTLDKRIRSFDPNCKLEEHSARMHVGEDAIQRWHAACARMAIILPELRVQLDKTDTIAVRFKDAISASQQRRAAFLRA